MFDRRRRVAIYALAGGLYGAVTVIAAALPVGATETAGRRSGSESPAPSHCPAARPSPFAGMFLPPLRISQLRENPRPAPPDFGEFEPRLISVSPGDSGRAVRDTVAATIHRSGSSTQAVIVPRPVPAEL